MAGASPHNVDTLKDLMDAEFRRVHEKFESKDAAVELAKQAADKANGTVNIVALVAVLAGVFSIIAVILTIASLFLHR